MENDHNQGNISDELKFSICGLCGVALSQAFPESYNEKFKKTVIYIILAHFDTSEKIKNTVLQITNGDGEDKMEPYYIMMKNCVSSVKVSNIDLLHELFVVFINQGEYSSRTRYFLRHLAYGLHLNIDHLHAIEDHFLELLDKDNQNSPVKDAESIKRDKKRRWKRGLLIGAAAIGGGVLIGVTGGLAAPFIATGIGAVGTSIAGGVGAAVTATSVAMGTTTGVAIVGSVFGGAGAGLTGYKMKRRVGDLKEFKIEPFNSDKSFTLTIAVSGLLHQGTSDFYMPWCTMGLSREQYYLVWESKYLAEMTHAVEYLMSFVKSAALTETLKYTALSTLLSAIVWPSALLTASSAIDNPWSVCCSRAELAGRILADSLISSDYGKRPVSLIGYSLGARVIFYCLLELASRQSNLVEDIIEDVFLIGAPITANVDTWNKIERVVSCRVINAYCTTDWILKFLYRTSNVTYHIAGLEPVKWVNKRICNMDITNIVSGHVEYSQKMPEILDFIGIKTNPFNLPMSKSTNSLKYEKSNIDSVINETDGLKRSTSDADLLKTSKESKKLLSNKTTEEAANSGDVTNNTPRSQSSDKINEIVSV